ncbi:MAG: carbon-nitrogen hydrolase family protein [Paracoccus sp. (in: a-proteobacteria)]|uniref:carbon-nitrogen hydrolase family protein n=1 Tax=Paracoccus sp. TaxID=267 RepID=UPI0026DEF5D4|nr:carbon-nitrogen hydrolase family protein [Paracoccus sp. (in: a-proteobacteria)]MDO5611698.1 carbon-nitrogen hydrolase family protein [Paracoccus sp. (in: a-proteobacteria)]
MTPLAPVRIGLIQMTASDDPQAHLGQTLAMIEQAAKQGAALILTPEVTNFITPDRARQTALAQTESDDLTLAALRQAAARYGVWLLIGSLALRPDPPAPGDDRLVNRSLLIAPDGAIAARYDKIHMFDVDISDTEQFRESAAFRPGDHAVLADGPLKIGMSICYDLRFPQLFRQLAQAGADILTVPSAFNPTTGAAHWETLLRARAIETGCFVLAPAQCGNHPAPHSPDRRPRHSYGHSLVVDPWGKVLADGGTAPGVVMADLNLETITMARTRVPSIRHDRAFGPV